MKHSRKKKVIDSMEVESVRPPHIHGFSYCETTLIWPAEVNTTTHHVQIDWFTCPMKEAKRYRITVEEL